MGRKARNLTAISVKRLRFGERQTWGEVSRVRFHGESLASRPSKPLLARKDRYVHGRHGLPGHTSVLVSDGENLASMFVLVRSLAGRGRRPSTEYDAHLEISSSTVVSRVLLGSTVDQVSALSPALNLTPSMNMVLTVARRRRRSANGAFLFGLCAIFGGRGCVGWVVIGHEWDTG